jgi:hypothetical protein
MSMQLLVMAAPTIPLAAWLGVARKSQHRSDEAEQNLWAMLAASWLMAVLWVVFR